VDAGVDGAQRLAANGNVVFVAAELRDVALDPPQHGLLVENAVIAEGVALIIEGGVRQEAHQIQAVR
jgi:hypothetical protein